MLKFETTANIGDTIKAFDFEPRKDAPGSYLVGEVVDRVINGGAKMYEVMVTESTNEMRIGTLMYVPYETFMDFDNRVTKVA